MMQHIQAQKGDIAKAILLPGDPMRAKYIAETFLEDPQCFNVARGMLGYTGLYNGKRISVMGTGMGMPSMAICATELMRDFGVTTLLRVGTAANLQEHVQLRDIIVAQSASTANYMNRRIFPGSFCPVSDFELLRNARKKADALNTAVRFGTILSGDMFYGEEPYGDNLWQKYNVLSGEMEAAALFTVAGRYGAKALAFGLITDNLFTNEHLSPQEREQSVDDMVRLGLETVYDFA